jgi:prevent-host-death family protein
MERIGVRELRRHASRYLARVAAGESIEVTDRGRTVARLVPVTGDPWADLLASGRVRPPSVDGDLLDLVVPAALPPGALRGTDVLAAMRAHER